MMAAIANLSDPELHDLVSSGCAAAFVVLAVRVPVMVWWLASGGRECREARGDAGESGDEWGA